MHKIIDSVKWFFLLAGIAFAYSCQPAEITTPQFRLLSANITNLTFENRLNPSVELNIFNYMYFYNGAGIAVGDFNNDALPDIFLAANQTANKLYLNKGNFKFEEISKAAGIDDGKDWSTGVSVIDINNDGWLDIYVCQVGKYRNLVAKNLLYINKGVGENKIPLFEEQAKLYGLDDVGFGTQAAFFDADIDGDLDMFLLRHTLHQNGTFGKRENFKQTEHALAGDKFYECVEGKYVDQTPKSGINSSAVGYGLGVVISDVNNDSYPDIYAGNDFQENDYLYINQQNGTFKDLLTEQINHTSRFTMGVDAADINNDGWVDIFGLDMLPYDKEILKKSEGEDTYDIFQFKLGFGYNHQYARNNLQLNNGNNTFSEVGLLANVYATDWSWATLIQDFNLDGNKDIFVSNGIPKRMNDIDYINFYADADFQARIEFEAFEEKDLAMLKKLPEIKLPNQFFINGKNLSFKKLAIEIENNLPSYSTAAAYADFDNDGDVDIVVNNINESPFIYENLTQNAAIKINLKGSKNNTNAIGAKIKLFFGDEIQLYEKYPVKGFLSSMEVPLSISQNDWLTADSIYIIWPDGGLQKLDKTTKAKAYTFNHKANRKKAIQNNATNTFNLKDITPKTKLVYTHKENPFVEFNREPLIPFMVAAEGPALAVGDINNDGLEDVFIGSAKRDTANLFLQTVNGNFIKSQQTAFNKNVLLEEVDAIFADIDNDGDKDLIIATGGNEYRQGTKNLNQLVYKNDSKGVFYEDTLSLPTNVNLTASTIAATDFDNDGDIDLFFGGRAVPWQYGEIPNSYLLQNNGTGKFEDVTHKFSKELSKLGFVKDAIWLDVNNDNQQDLVVALEWDGIVAFIKNGQKFEKQYLSNSKNYKGWWNNLYPTDIDADGDIDIIAGNAGLNNKLQPSKNQPVKMYYNDFDANGVKEQILTYFINSEEVPFATKMELEKQMPFLKKKYLLAADFAKATLPQLIPKIANKNTTIFEANYFANAILINNGEGNFELNELPLTAQYAPIKAALEIQPGKVLLLGNFYENNIQMGRSDASYGTLLQYNNKQGLSTLKTSPPIKGQVKNILPIKIKGQASFIVAKNNAAIAVYVIDNY